MRFIIGFFCISLAGCATTLSSAGSGVIQADEKMVAACKFLGQVEGSSGFGNIASSVGMANARNEATEKAARLGATHILFVNVSGGYSPNAQGRAYDCRPPRS
jgi:hypothetical protein